MSPRPCSQHFSISPISGEWLLLQQQRWLLGTVQHDSLSAETTYLMLSLPTS